MKYISSHSYTDVPPFFGLQYATHSRGTCSFSICCRCPQTNANANAECRVIFSFCFIFFSLLFECGRFMPFGTITPASRFTGALFREYIELSEMRKINIPRSKKQTNHNINTWRLQSVATREPTSEQRDTNEMCTCISLTV